MQTRSKALISSFLVALTVGGPNGTPRPIEMHAHDPQRYVGDMLAWIHQAVASEYEFMNRVFGVEGIIFKTVLTSYPLHALKLKSSLCSTTKRRDKKAIPCEVMLK